METILLKEVSIESKIALLKELGFDSSQGIWRNFQMFFEGITTAFIKLNI